MANRQAGQRLSGFLVRNLASTTPLQGWYREQPVNRARLPIAAQEISKTAAAPYPGASLDHPCRGRSLRVYFETRQGE